MASFNEVFTRPDNEVFKIVFFPDRIYHSAYLNATRSSRYRYNIQEAHTKLDITGLKGQVHLDGDLLCNFLRIEYRASRLVEAARTRGRLLDSTIYAEITLEPPNKPPVKAYCNLTYCRWTDAYQVELWETLEPPPNRRHDYAVLTQMGKGGSITRIKEFSAALKKIDDLKHIRVAFAEGSPEVPIPDSLPDNRDAKNQERQWDTNYQRNCQVPNTDQPSSDQNTVHVNSYLLDFQRSYFLDAREVKPVRYKNALMDDNNPDRKDDNVIEMRWILQEELGGSVVFFHEVTVPPGKIEGTHQHVGSEECYYVVSGEGIAYMAAGDDPATDKYELVDHAIYGQLPRPCRKIPVRQGHTIYAKSGGVHGMENTGTEPLKFVSFLYHTS